MDSRCSSSADSRLNGRGVGSLNARLESYEAGEKTCISAVRRTFCLFVTFDLLFISLLWIIELNVRPCFCSRVRTQMFWISEPKLKRN